MKIGTLVLASTFFLVVLAASLSDEMTLVAHGSSWKYLDNGSNQKGGRKTL